MKRDLRRLQNTLKACNLYFSMRPNGGIWVTATRLRPGVTYPSLTPFPFLNDTYRPGSVGVEFRTSELTATSLCLPRLQFNWGLQQSTHCLSCRMMLLAVTASQIPFFSSNSNLHGSYFTKEGRSARAARGICPPLNNQQQNPTHMKTSWPYQLFWQLKYRTHFSQEE